MAFGRLASAMLLAPVRFVASPVSFAPVAQVLAVFQVPEAAVLLPPRLTQGPVPSRPWGRAASRLRRVERPSLSAVALVFVAPAAVLVALQLGAAGSTPASPVDGRWSRCAPSPAAASCVRSAVRLRCLSATARATGFSRRLGASAKPRAPSLPLQSRQAAAAVVEARRLGVPFLPAVQPRRVVAQESVQAVNSPRWEQPGVKAQWAAELLSYQCRTGWLTTRADVRRSLPRPWPLRRMVNAPGSASDCGCIPARARRGG